MWKEKLQSLLLKLFGCYKVLESFMKKQGLYDFFMLDLCKNSQPRLHLPIPISEQPPFPLLYPLFKNLHSARSPHPLDSGWNFQPLPSKKKEKGWGCKLWSFIAMSMILMWRHRHQMKYILKNKKCWEHKA